MQAGVTFNNIGTVDVQQGNLRLEGGGNSSGGSITANGTGTTILVSGSYNLNGTATGTNLVEDGGNLIGTNIVNGGLTWLSGAWTGALTVASNSVVNIARASNAHYLGNCIVSNYGTVNWRDDILYAGGSSPATVIYNYGLWNAEDDRALSTTFFGGNIVFDNFGTFRKSGGASGGYSQMQADVTFNNTGTVDVQQGNLRLEGGGNFSGGSITTNGAGTTIVVSGSYNLNGTATGTNLVEDGADLIGTTVINGGLTWFAGSWIGAVTVASNSVVNIALASNDHYLGNCIVTNYGTVNWRDDILYAGGSSPATVIYNYGLWNAEDDRALSTTFFGGNIVFDNFGTFRKSGGASGGFSQMQAGVTFNNTGTVDVQQGNLRLEGGGNFTGGSITTNGAGTTILVDGSYNLNGTATGTNLVEYGADLIGTTVINGGLTWFAGSWIGAVTVASNSVVNIALASNDHYLGNCIVTNYGTVNWRDDILYAGGSSPATVIYNYGLWNAEDDRALSTTFFGGNIVFDNFGTFRKSGGASGGYSQMQADVTFNNTGTVDVQQGNLRLEGGGNFSGGSITTNGAGTTILVSGSYNLNGTATGTNLVEDGADLIGTTVINGGLTWFAGSWIGEVHVASNTVVK